MTAVSDETGREALESPQHIVEGIILRRLHDKRIEGYTLEMSKEIAAALSASPVGELTPEQISIQNDMFAAWVGDPKFREAFRNDCKRLLSVSLVAQEPVAYRYRSSIDPDWIYHDERLPPHDMAWQDEGLEEQGLYRSTPAGVGADEIARIIATKCFDPRVIDSSGKPFWKKSQWSEAQKAANAILALLSRDKS